MTAQPTALPLADARGVDEPAPGASPFGRRIVVGPGAAPDGGGPSLVLDLDGERIAAAEVTIGRGHDGLEKRLESLSWYQALPYVERVSADSGALAATAYCRAVEQLLGLELPERAEWLRVLLCEVGRVTDHTMRLAATCRALGAHAAASWLVAGRVRIVSWVEALTGARHGSHFVRLGGVRRPLPDALTCRLRAELPGLERLIDDVERSVGRLRSATDRLRGEGALDAIACARFGVTGVLLRAAGQASDLRRTPGYSVYPEIDFDVVVGSVGDNADRLLVCLEEVRQSARIVAQCLDRLESLGPGPIGSDDPRVGWEARGRDRLGAAEMIRLTMAVTSGPRVPAGDAYAAVEGANGELGFYVVSNGGARPLRVRCRAPGFLHARALPTMLVGAPVAEVATTLALANVDAVECDR